MNTYLVSLSLFSFLTVPVAVVLDWLDRRRFQTTTPSTQPKGK